MSNSNWNIIIANFVGIEKSGYIWIDKEEFIEIEGNNTFEYLEFDTNWNWLMAVKQKIEAIVLEDDSYFEVNILGGC